MDMTQLMDVVTQNWYIFAAMGVAVVVSIVYAIVRSRSMKSGGAKFLASHPDAAKIYLTSKALITSEAVEVHLVDGDKPNRFVEGGKTGIYVAPGTSTLQLSYTYSRPGVMYKTVTKGTGVVEQRVETAPGGTYMLGFDREAETFTFGEA